MARKKMTAADMAELFGKAHDQHREVVIRLGDRIFPIESLILMIVPARVGDVLEVVGDAMEGEGCPNYSGYVELVAGN